MSVSGVGSVPGFDVLFPSTGSTGASSGTSSAAPASGTSSSSPASGTLSSSVPGSDVLNAPLNTENVPGFDVLNPAQYFPNAQQIVNGSGSSSNSSSSSSSGSTSTSSNGVNPYQQTYDNIETWSDNYLLSAIQNGAPALTTTGTASSNTLSSDGGLLSSLKSLAQINAAAGVGTSNATPASSTSTKSTTPTDPAEAALGALPTFSYGTSNAGTSSSGTSNVGTSSSGTNINTYA